MKLSNKVAVIIGGNSGIGLATAKEFAANGADVAILGRDRRTLDEAKNVIGGERYFHLVDPDGHELSFARLLRSAV
jgi:NAD(P)-dependent dehydrogenase (short-subunit alcohol dehydrogenase family)